MPVVSVIVPNYNHARFLPQRLQSIFDQTFQDFEVILLDDCSSDNSREILEQYRNHPKVSVVLFNEINSGSTFKQWGKGIGLSTGDYIWIAESDDYCENTFLNELVAKLDEFPTAGIAYCQSVSVNTENKFLSNWIEHTDVFNPNIWDDDFQISGDAAIRNYLLYRNIIPNTSAVVFRKSVFKKTSGININFSLNGDWLLWINILKYSDLVFVAKNLNFFRQHSNKATISNTANYKGLREMLDLFCYIQDDFHITKAEKKTMTELALKRWIYQFIHCSYITSIKNIPVISKHAYKFNTKYYLYFIHAVFDLTVLFFQRKLFLNKTLVLITPPKNPDKYR